MPDSEYTRQTDSSKLYAFSHEQYSDYLKIQLCTRLHYLDIAQQHIPELNCSTLDLRFFTFNINGNIFLGGVFIFHSIIGFSLETLVDGNNANVASIGLSFKITDVVNVVPRNCNLI